MSHSPLKKITDRERSYVKTVTTSPIGNMLVMVRENQGVLAAILGERCTSQTLSSAMLRAVCGLSTQALNLARSAEILVSTGYSLQSLVLARAVYETTAACIYYRTHPEAADAWMRQKESALPKYATVAEPEMATLLDEYASVRGHGPLEQPAFEAFKQTVPKLYGILSAHTHPTFYVVQHQVYIAKDSQVRWLNIGPDLRNEVAVAYSLLSLSVLNLHQIVLEVLLLLEFRESNLMDWDEIVQLWEKVFFGTVHQFKMESDKVAALFASSMS